MTILIKTVRRRTSDRIFERSRKRGVIVSLEPPNMLSFRLEGTQRSSRRFANPTERKIT